MNSNNYYKAPQDQQGKHFGAGRNYNHYDTENSGGKGTLGSNNQRSQNQYSNNQNTNVSSVGSNWVWRVGDECLAKYWEDNRVR